jgi:predicted ATPase/class 3 adenylate cyclase
MTGPAVDLPTGTVTFLFTDIEGSTKLLQQLGDAYADLLGKHNRLLNRAVVEVGGVAVGSEGDSLFAAFRNAPSALRAAVSAQQALARESWPQGVAVRVRMGLHTGTGVLGEGSYIGIDVHRAARIAAAGHGGQILLSDATRGLVEGALPEGVELRDLGRHRLKDLSQPERISETVIQGLPSQFPALRSLDATPNNLPSQMTSFVGRTREVAGARRLLAGTRLLTLTGPGGTGKTRLSLQLAAEAASDFTDGVCFVPLDSIDDAEMVAAAIVSALGLREAVNKPPLGRLIDHLRDRCLLLVLDNFEQVLPARALVAELLRACPDLRVVITSRAPIHVYGEREFEVPPLGLPDAASADAATLARSESVALFVDRARAVKPDFGLTAANAALVGQICARLDGLPLAIELAAARIKLLPPQALLERLGKRLDLLAAGSRDLPARQQTLRGAIAWSHDLLDPENRKLLARFSVFVEGADLEAAEAVCGPDIDVLSGLEDLVDQSLVQQRDVDGEPRFAMLFTIREFALEKLAESGEADDISGRHADFFLGLAEACAPGLTGSDQKRLHDRLDRENGNLRAALSWSIERGRTEASLRMGSAMWRFWQMRGLLNEGSSWLDRILALPDAGDHPRELAQAYEAAGGIAYWRADMPEATRFYQESLDLCRRIGDPEAIANALYNVGFPGLVNTADVPGAKAVLEESLEIYRTLGDRGMIARVLWGLGNALFYSHENEAARDALLEDVAIFRTLDDPFGLAWALHTLGLVYYRLGKAASESPPLWIEALDHFASVSDISGLTILIADFGLLALADGDIPRALTLRAASERFEELGGVHLGSLFHIMEKTYPDTFPLDEELVERAVGAGRSMSVAEAIEFALAGSPSVDSVSRAVN